MIISFYSYKGGVGRSQMCANVAAYLALKKGKKVLLWDWDFEAPGLHYYFDKTNADIQNISTIEVLDAYSNMMRTTSDVSEADYKYFPSKAFVPLVELTKTRLGEGKVDLLPGGNYNDNYVNKINRFNWFEFYELLDGSVYIESLKNWAKSLEYDYILIDSRTGINDYSGICNLQLPDTNVVVMAANEQNIAGCRRIIDQITHHEYVKQGYRKPYLFPVLSRINANNPDYQKWSERFTDEFYELLPKLDTDINPLFTKEIFRDFYLEKTLLEDDPRFSAGENLLFNTTRQTFPKNALISKYVNISEYFENLKAGNSIEINNEIDIATWEGYAEEAILDENKNKAAYAFEKAEQYDKSIEYGGTAQVFMEKANDASLNNKQKEAIVFYEKAIEIDANNENAFFYMGLAYYGLQEYSESIKCYEKAIAIRPDLHEAFNNMGLACYKLQEYSEAIKCYENAIEIKPDDHEAFNNMGNAYYGLQEYSESIKSYEKAISIKHDYHEAFYNMGNAYDELQEYSESIKSYEKAISIKHDYHEAFYNMGLAYRKLNEYSESIKSYEKAISIKHDYHE
ncbi:MAG: tetratricopeptide repeat protein, partial [Saprospiraceae bacterium]